MRLFVAIDISGDVKDYLRKISNNISSDYADVKLVNKNQMHLTLKFLGEVEEVKADVVKDNLRKIRFNRFKLKLSEIGVFPNEEYVKVVWVGLKENKTIMRLQQDIESSLSDSSKKGKEFHPHLTLGRVRSVNEKVKFMEIIKSIRFDAKEFETDSFRLIMSTLTREGPVYDTIEIFKAQ